MLFTTNGSTTTVGQCTATCLARTKHKGKTIVTWELMYPRYIHPELLTHRAFSRNASSSRATPLKVTLDEVYNTPAFFDHVGLNQAGMVAGRELSPARKREFEAEWRNMGAKVADWVSEMQDKYGIHKQVLNRALEPWLRIRTLVTATDIKPFFKLRIAKDAQPEMQNLARAMKAAMEKAVVREDKVHLPYRDFFVETDRHDQIVRNIAACGRVCIMRSDGKETSFDDDQNRVYDWLKAGHMSPFEHVASYDGKRVRNFDGWKSIRAEIEDGECEWLR